MECLYAKVDMVTANDRFLLMPDCFNDFLGSEFTAFLDHMARVSEKLKQLFLDSGYNVDTWKSPVCANNGVLHSLQVSLQSIHTMSIQGMFPFSLTYNTLIMSALLIFGQTCSSSGLWLNAVL
jgi:hypothetical protein